MSSQVQAHSDSSGFTAGLLLGLIIGGAGGYLLSSDKGQELLENLKSEAGDKLKSLAENPALADKLSELEGVMQQARATLESGKTEAISQVHDVATRLADSTAPEPAPPKKKNFFFRSGSRLGK